MLTVLLLAMSLQSAPLKFANVAAGANSQIEEPRNTVVRTAAEWETLWREHGGQGKPAAVDFGKEMVVAVFLGTRPTAGFAVEITAIEGKDGGFAVTYRERQPKPDEMVAQMLTAPFHIVRAPAREGKATFTRSAAR